MGNGPAKPGVIPLSTRAAREGPPHSAFAIVEALRSAGATEEMLAAAIAADRGARAPHRAKDAERKRRARAAKGGAHPGRRSAEAVARPTDIPPRPSDTAYCQGWKYPAR
jgi:hypothetical protein